MKARPIVRLAVDRTASFILTVALALMINER